VEQEVGLGVVGDEDVGAAIAVVIGERDAHAFADVAANTGGLRDVGEGAVAVVAVERVGEAGVHAGMAVGALAGARLDARGLGGGIPVDVVDDERSRRLSPS